MRVHFFQPAQFNRTERKTNPFFDPIIEICQREGVLFRFFEMAKPLSPSGYECVRSSWILMWPEILGFRLLKWFHLPSRPVWLLMGGVVNVLTLGRFRADVCITIAGVHLEILQGINPKARLVDLQHGMIYSRHSGYFDQKGRLLPCLAENPQREYWVYGEGFRTCFFSVPENVLYLKNKVHVVGDVLRAERVRSVEDCWGNRRKVVLAMQFVSDFPQKTLLQMKGLWENFLERISELVRDHAMEVVLRHHPRFCGEVDLSDWQVRFPWLKSDVQPWKELFRETLCCVTVSSTVAFDAAAYGVPSFFLDAAVLGWENPIVEEYAYPLTQCSIERVLCGSEREIKEMESQIRVWYSTYYSLFKAEIVVTLLKGI